jgi:hypothetical protein
MPEERPSGTPPGAKTDEIFDPYASPQTEVILPVDPGSCLHGARPPRLLDRLSAHVLDSLPIGAAVGLQTVLDARWGSSLVISASLAYWLLGPTLMRRGMTLGMRAMRLRFITSGPPKALSALRLVLIRLLPQYAIYHLAMTSIPGWSAVARVIILINLIWLFIERKYSFFDRMAGVRMVDWGIVNELKL